MAMGLISWRKVTIANGDSLSGPLDITGQRVVALQQAASNEGTSFTFQGSWDGTTYADLQSDSAELSVTKSATVAQLILLLSKAILGPNFIKVRSGSSASATVQVGAQTVLVGLEDVNLNG